MENQWFEDCKIFRELCENHDITYVYSDDGSVYNRGKEQYDDLVAYSKRIPRHLAVQIWNESVDKKFLYESDRADYRWSE